MSWIKKYISVILLMSLVGLLVAPQTLLAAWWNPFTWKVLNRITEIRIQKTATVPTDNKSSEIENLKKEIGKLKEKPTPNTVKPKPTTTPIISINSQPSWIRGATPTPTQVIQEPYLTPEQLAKIKALNEKLNQLEQLQNQQKQQQELARQQELKRLECIMAMTPEGERVFDPATQDYLRKLRCGIATDADRNSYELSMLRYTLNELKYKLDSKVSFSPVLLRPLQSPSSNTIQWQIRWDGFGGTITDSVGKLHQFHCEDNFCRSY